MFRWIFKTILRICVYVPSRFFSSEFVRVNVSQPYNRTDSTIAIISLSLNFLLSFEFQMFLIWWQILQACAFLILTYFCCIYPCPEILEIFNSFQICSIEYIYIYIYIYSFDIKLLVVVV